MSAQRYRVASRVPGRSFLGANLVIDYAPEHTKQGRPGYAQANCRRI
jgi:hypothetical protein